MTTAADDSAVEDAFEALLAGRPVPEEAAGLVAFTASVRATATSPGRPSAALADLLATGLLIDQSSPSARTARSAGTPPSRESRVRRRRRSTMFLPALFAKFLSAGALAQAATGAGVVLVVATGAGATGLLGEDVQDTVSSVVGASDETADEAASEDTTVVADETTDPGAVETPAVSTEVPVEAELTPEEWIASGPAEGQKFGDWVSLSTHNPELREWLRAEGKTFGSMVRDWANKKGMDDADLVEEGVDLDDLTEEPTTEPVTDVTDDTDATDDTEVASTQGGRGNGGNGGGNGNGHGKN